jgi:cytochrome c-type biogenesis protein CcmE
MTRKQKRTALIGAALAGLAIASTLVLFALNDTIVFFYSPSDLVSKQVAAGKRIRIGGLVEKGSLKKLDGTRISFAVTDTAKTLKVNYQGLLPDLFREGQGVIAEGVVASDGSFLADSVLAKHDEKYMPPEVAKALKDKGVWRGNEDGAKPASGAAATN